MVFKKSETEKINFLEDIQDTEDYQQFKSVLRLVGRNEIDIDKIISSWKKRTEAKYNYFIDAIEVKAFMETPSYKSWFECIVNPTHKKLKKMPRFHRYIAYLLIQYDHEKCASILDMTRMSLWRWRKTMGYLN
tara:strand:- start:37 stop:435 length:399 start_codon:yes stop_codon:yes gene_type:complete